jgi:hypothetical protein
MNCPAGEIRNTLCFKKNAAQLRQMGAFDARRAARGWPG